MIKAIAIDLDKTTLRSDCSLSERTIRVFEAVRARGIETIICTGRSLHETRWSAARLPVGRYMVLLTGAQVWDNDSEAAIARTELPGPDAAAAVSRLRRESSLFFQLYSGERLYTCPENLPALMRCGLEPDDLAMTRSVLHCEERLEQRLLDGDIPAEKFFLLSPEAGVAEAVRRDLAQRPGLYLTGSYGHTLEIMRAGADKGAGLARVMALLGIRREELMAFGDSENDLPMFEQAGLCVAVGNAQEAVRARAHHIAPDNDSDGVAHAVETLILRGSEAAGQPGTTTSPRTEPLSGQKEDAR